MPKTIFHAKYGFSIATGMPVKPFSLEQAAAYPPPQPAPPAEEHATAAQPIPMSAASDAHASRPPLFANPLFNPDELERHFPPYRPPNRLFASGLGRALFIASCVALAIGAGIGAWWVSSIGGMDGIGAMLMAKQGPPARNHAHSSGTSVGELPYDGAPPSMAQDERSRAAAPPDTPPEPPNDALIDDANNGAAKEPSVPPPVIAKEKKPKVVNAKVNSLAEPAAAPQASASDDASKPVQEDTSTVPPATPPEDKREDEVDAGVGTPAGKPAVPMQAKSAARKKHKPARKHQPPEQKIVRNKEIDRIQQQAEEESKKKSGNRRAAAIARAKSASARYSRRVRFERCERMNGLFRREQCKWHVCGGKWGKEGCPSYTAKNASYY